MTNPDPITHPVRPLTLGERVVFTHLEEQLFGVTNPFECEDGGPDAEIIYPEPYIGQTGVVVEANQTSEDDPADQIHLVRFEDGREGCFLQSELRRASGSHTFRIDVHPGAFQASTIGYVLSAIIRLSVNGYRMTTVDGNCRITFDSTRDRITVQEAISGLRLATLV